MSDHRTAPTVMLWLLVIVHYKCYCTDRYGSNNALFQWLRIYYSGLSLYQLQTDFNVAPFFSFLQFFCETGQVIVLGQHK